MPRKERCLIKPDYRAEEKHCLIKPDYKAEKKCWSIRANYLLGESTV